MWWRDSLRTYNAPVPSGPHNHFCIGVQQVSDATARVFIDVCQRLEKGRAQAAIAPFGLNAFLHCLYRAGWQRTKGASVEVDMCCGGGHFLADILYLREVWQGTTPPSVWVHCLEL